MGICVIFPEPSTCSKGYRRKIPSCTQRKNFHPFGEQLIAQLLFLQDPTFLNLRRPQLNGELQLDLLTQNIQPYQLFSSIYSISDIKSVTTCYYLQMLKKSQEGSFLDHPSYFGHEKPTQPPSHLQMLVVEDQMPLHFVIPGTCPVSQHGISAATKIQCLGTLCQNSATKTSKCSLIFRFFFKAIKKSYTLTENHLSWLEDTKRRDWKELSFSLVPISQRRNWS